MNIIKRLSALWPALPFLGLAPCFTWRALMRGGIWMSASEVNGDALSNLNMTFDLTMFVVLALLILSRRQLGHITFSRQAAIFASILGFVGTLILILAGPYYSQLLFAAIGNPKWIFSVGSIMCGTAFAILFLQIGMRYCMLPFRHAILYLCYSHIIVVFIYLAVVVSPAWSLYEGAPTYTTAFVFAIMPLIAMLFQITPFDVTRWTKKDELPPRIGFTSASDMKPVPGIERPEKGFFSIYAKFAIVLLIFTFVCSGMSNTVISAAVPEALISQTNFLILLRIPIIAAAAIAVIAVDAKRINFSKLCIAAIMLLELCMIISLTVAASNEVWFDIMQTVSFFFELLTWSLVFAVGGAHRKNATVIVGAGLAAISLGGGFGCFITLMAPSLFGAVPMSVISIILLLPTILLVGERDLDALMHTTAAADETDTPDTLEEALGDKISAGEHLKGPFRIKLDAYAASRSLTSRETETLHYLVTGRGDSQIAEAMGVSYNTARTHVRNVYAKCGVHGRKELIDYIDAHFS